MTDTLSAKSPRKRTKASHSARRTGTTVSEQIMEAVATTKERRGLSLSALKKILSGGGYDVARNNWRVNQAVRSLVSKGSLMQTAGTGASGSFKVSKTQKDKAIRTEEKPKTESTGTRRRRKGLAKRPAAAKKPKKPKKRGAPKKTKKHGASRKVARGTRKEKITKGRKPVRSGRKGKHTKPRKLAKHPEKAQEADKPPAHEETSVSEKKSKVCSEHDSA
ncbi:histone H1-like [Heptranchias perlo]|uniref:histone H1-like n=1 Tax=Heptranchias perlo TaxID=212740 RepID=UPI00355939CE